MKAIVLSRYGGPELFEMTEIPKPTPQPGEVLVQVIASAVDPGNMKRATGAMRAFAPELEFPWIPGAAISGTVESVGEGVTAFRAGDAVYGYKAGGGAYAQFVAVSAGALALKPVSLDHAQAASIAVSGQTALLTLEAAGIQAGQSILIIGAAGAVGSAAVLLSKARGARVLAMCRSRSADRVRALGADEIVDADSAASGVDVKGVDFVLDTVGGNLEQKALSALKPGGLLIAIVQPPSQEAADRHHVRAVLVRTESRTATLAELGRQVDTRKIRSFVGRTYPLHETAQAWKDFSARRVDGKIIIQIAPEPGAD